MDQRRKFGGSQRLASPATLAQTAARTTNAIASACSPPRDVDAEVGRRKRQKRHAADGRRPPSKAAVIVLRQSAVPYAAFAVSPNSFTFSMTDLVAVSKSFTLSMAVLVAVSPKSLTCSLRASICDRTNSVCIGMS
jgi:hypothetical protein